MGNGEMLKLLATVLEANGGTDRWDRYEKINATPSGRSNLKPAGLPPVPYVGLKGQTMQKE
jgi:hypothetical protein